MPSAFGVIERDRTYYPRCLATLTVPVFGTTQEIDAQAHGSNTVDIPVRVRKARLERNDHRTADTLNIEVDWRDSGVDPRFLKSSTIQFWLTDIGPDANVGDGGQTILDDSDLQFIGTCVKVHRVASAGSGFQVDMEFHDFTRFFLDQKPFADEGVPLFTDTLQQAWARVCSQVGYKDLKTKKLISNVSALVGQLKIDQSVPSDLIVGEGIPERVRKFGKQTVRDSDSAWDVWARTIGAMGLLTFFENDRVVVTTTTEHYGPKRSPVLLWGTNIEEASESANSMHLNKGVGLTSFNTETGSIIESVFPPPGDPLVHIKRTQAGKKNFNPEQLQSDQYEWFEYHDVQSQEQLDAVAASAFAERSRQELEGTIKTREMRIETVDKDQFDLLTLRAGDPIHISIESFDKDQLRAFGSQAKQEEYLQTFGFSPQLAELIAKNSSALEHLNDDFHVKRCAISLDENNFEVEINYCNLIDIKGYAKKPEGPVTESLGASANARAVSGSGSRGSRGSS